MSFNPGEQIGVYRIIEQLGQGGMATVYKAYHPALDRYVALKVLHPAFLEDKNFHARFEREAKLVARLEHPNIVPIYDYAEHQGRPFLVMKYIEGETLKARIARGSLGNADVLKIVEAVGTGLAYAHMQGILHRDVKPSNVILANDGQIYLADFGLARIAQSGDSTLTADMIMGTPQYISPEQAMGNKKLDEGTDIYSFGVILYEMTVGRVPFSADTPFSIIHDHIYSPLPLPSVVNPNISPDLERVLLKSLAKNREDRFPDVATMVDAFKQTWLYLTQAANTATIPQVSTPISGMLGADNQPTLMEAAGRQPLVSLAAAQTDSRLGQQVSGNSDAELPNHRKKYWKWLLIGSPIFICLCCISILILARNSEQKIITSVQSTVSSIIGTSVPPELAPTVQMAVETSMPSSSSVEAARKKVEQNPDDPNAHFELAVAYQSSGLTRMASAEFAKAIELGSNNEVFLRDTAVKLISNEYWLPASLVYLKLARNFSENMTPEDRDNMHMVVYKSADVIENQLPLAAPLEGLNNADLSLAGVVQVRFLIARGNLVQARQALDKIEKENPDVPEIPLLRAEIALKEGNIDEGIVTLKELITSDKTPKWIVDEANKMLENL